MKTNTPDEREITTKGNSDTPYSKRKNTLNTKYKKEKNDCLLILEELNIYPIDEEPEETEEIIPIEVKELKPKKSEEIKQNLNNEVPVNENFNKQDKKETPNPINKSINNSISENKNNNENKNKNLESNEGTPTPDPFNSKKIQPMRQLFVDYEFKVKDTEKNQQYFMKENLKSLIQLDNMKNNIFRYFKLRKIGIHQRNLEKSNQQMTIETTKNNNETIRTENTSQFTTKNPNVIPNKKMLNLKKIGKIVKKIQIKKKKRMNKYLLHKKIKKQQKKKKRVISNIYKKNLVLDKKENLSKYIKTNWLNYLDDQIRNQYNNTEVNTASMMKELAQIIENKLTPIETEPQVIQKNLNRLVSFDGEEYADKKDIVVVVAQKLNVSNNDMNNSALNITEKENKIKEYRSKIEKLQNIGNYLNDVTLIVEKATKGVTCKNDEMVHTLSNIIDSHVLNETRIEQPKEKLNEAQKLAVKQRMINFSMRIFDRFDIKKVLEFWRDNRSNGAWRDRLIKKLGETTKKGPAKSEANKDAVPEEKEKKKSKNEMFFKQNYSKPTDAVKRYIPFCGNIYNIQKNEN